MGAKLVLPGPHLAGDSVYHLLETYRVTVSASVPTVWLGLLQYLEQHKLGLSYLKSAVIGGAAPPRSMIEALER